MNKAIRTRGRKSVGVIHIANPMGATGPPTGVAEMPLTIAVAVTMAVVDIVEGTGVLHADTAEVSVVTNATE